MDMRIQKSIEMYCTVICNIGVFCLSLQQNFERPDNILDEFTESLISE